MNISLLPGEEWRPVPGWEALYAVSNLGRVYSFRRRRLMSPVHHTRGYRHIEMKAGGPAVRGYVHRLVMEAFVGPCPDDLEVRHLDGDPANNRLSNLAYGNHAENEADKVRHGTHHWARQTSCINGHEFTEQNTLRSADGRRLCRPCARFRNRAYRERQLLKSAGYAPHQDGAA